MATPVYSFKMNGVKQSFADWISNLSPADTPFTSSIKKEQTSNTRFQWQTDTLAAPAENTNLEGAKAVDGAATYTTLQENWTQIFAKTVRVSETAEAVDKWGRGSELSYQMEKKGKSLLRDIERAFLVQTDGYEQKAGATKMADARHTKGVPGLAAAKGAIDPDTKAVVHKEAQLTEAAIFDLTEQLYIAGSKANVIMFNPKHATKFAGFVEVTGQAMHRVRMFSGIANRLNVYVQTIIDPLGCEFTLVPNRLMPEDRIYIYNPEDFTQMTLRAPKRVPLSRDGDSVREMIITETGLRLSNPFAVGILEVLPDTAPATITAGTAPTNFKVGDDITIASLFTIDPAATAMNVSSSNSTIASVDNSSGKIHGVKVGTVTLTASAPGATDVTLDIEVKDSGITVAVKGPSNVASPVASLGVAANSLATTGYQLTATPATVDWSLKAPVTGVTVSNTGLVKATAAAAGGATIVATSKVDPTKKAEFVITTIVA